MDAHYYKEYYHLERNHWWFVARGNILMNYIRKNIYSDQPLRILNVGAATGRSSELLQQFGKVESLEYDKACFEFTRDNVKIDIINASVLDLPYEDNSFDLVCAFDVIEHVEDDALAVREMQRVCKPGGQVFVTVPAYMFLWSEHDVVNHHFRRYKLNELSHLFTSGRINYKSYFNFWLFPPIAFFRILSKLFSREKKEGESGSDFGVMGGQGMVNSIFHFIFNTENIFIKNKIRLPFGVSAILCWEKERK